MWFHDRVALLEGQRIRQEVQHPVGSSTTERVTLGKNLKLPQIGHRQGYQTELLVIDRRLLIYFTMQRRLVRESVQHAVENGVAPLYVCICIYIYMYNTSSKIIIK